MHALYFLSRERGKTSRLECPTCDEKKGEGKGEMAVIVVFTLWWWWWCGSGKNLKQ